jgi:hypothetical protein
MALTVIKMVQEMEYASALSAFLLEPTAVPAILPDVTLAAF